VALLLFREFKRREETENVAHAPKKNDTPNVIIHNHCVECRLFFWKGVSQKGLQGVGKLIIFFYLGVYCIKYGTMLCVLVRDLIKIIFIKIIKTLINN